MNGKVKLRVETSINNSGNIINEPAIPLLRDDEYVVKNFNLDGDAPKQFIKAYFFTRDSSIKKSSPDSWSSYIAKTAAKWYPHESIVEYMINRIGQELGLNMNDIKLARANGQIRFLSRYFLKENEKLIHGAEICGEHLGDMMMAKQIADHKLSSRELFTFEFIQDAIRLIFPHCFENLLVELVKMIVFDALVGNNDRHFYNWGVIGNKKKTTKLPTFAPIYDSARGLLWNYSDENIKKIYKQGGNKIVSYVDEACPRISIEENKQANHFQLIDFIKRYNTDYHQIVNTLSSIENERKVLRMLEIELFQYFIRERAELIETIVKARFKKVREI